MVSELSYVIADKLLQARKASGLTQRQVAARVGVKENTYANWEKARAEPSIDMIYKLCQFFGESFDEWLGFSKKTSDNTNCVNDDDILEILKNDPQVRLVAKIQGELTEEGKKDLLKYAELLRNQRDRHGDD